MSVLDDMPPAFVEQLRAARCVAELRHGGRRIRVTYRPLELLGGAWIPGADTPISEEAALEALSRAIVAVSCPAEDLEHEPGLAVAVADAMIADCVAWLPASRLRFEAARSRRR